MKGSMQLPRAILVLAILSAAALPALAQDDDRFREISPGLSDVTPGMRDAELRPIDLRTPMGFDRIYEIVDSGGLFARRAGAVTAVFDRSVYAWDATPMVPPGTVYYIGELPVDLGRPGLFSPLRREDSAARPSPFRVPESALLRRADQQADTRPVAQRVDLRVGSPAAEGLPPAKSLTSVWTNEEHRQRRVSELIRGAVWRWREAQASQER